MNMFAVRLSWGQDLKSELDKLVKENGIKSGYIATCVGSLKAVKLRMAGAKPEKQDIRTYNGCYKIVSLVGTLSADGSHLHMSVSDADGNVVGGHLKEGSIVETTAEVIIGHDENLEFKRVFDEKTGFEELFVF